MNRIKELRKARKMSQAVLADILGVTRSTVSMWEIDKSEPDADMFVRIADLFGVSTDDVLGRVLSNEAQKEKPAVPDIEAAKVALFGGDGEVTDEMLEEALFAAQLIKERHRRKNDK